MQSPPKKEESIGSSPKPEKRDDDDLPVAIDDDSFLVKEHQTIVVGGEKKFEDGKLQQLWPKLLVVLSQADGKIVFTSHPRSQDDMDAVDSTVAKSPSGGSSPEISSQWLDPKPNLCSQKSIVTTREKRVRFVDPDRTCLVCATPIDLVCNAKTRKFSGRAANDR